METHNGIVSFDRLCKILGVDNLEKYQDFIYANSSFPSDWTEEDVEHEENEAIQKYIDAVVSVATDLFSKHGMELVELKTKPLNYRLYSNWGWKGICAELMKTINGVGYFHFNSLKEFMDEGPYKTPRQAALHRLGWIADYPKVYGSSTARLMVHNRLRR